MKIRASNNFSCDKINFYNDGKFIYIDIDDKIIKLAEIIEANWWDTSEDLIIELSIPLMIRKEIE